MPLLQGRFQPIPLKPLYGVTIETEKPDFNLEAYRSGDYAKQEEAYLGEHFGFREPVIRLYNQYLWSCYKKTYAHDVMAGKQGWLYTPESVSDYYGTELLNWQPSVEEAKSTFEREVKYMCRARDILKENDVELLAFIAPEKSFVYPEYLPEGRHDTTTFNACATFLHRFQENGFPCIDMPSWFALMKDTVPYPLIPQTGAHWVFPAVYAADSLIRFMEQQRAILMPHIEYGNEWHSTCCIGDEQNRDLEGELNLLRPIKFNPKYAYKERDFWVVSDSTTVKPSALFIGNSFLLRTMAYLPPKEVFSDFQFWYYNRVAYEDSQKIIDSVSTFNRLDYLIDADYIVWFSSASQMYRATEGFAEDAIIQLCIGEERFRQRQDQLIDSLFHDQNTHNTIAWNYPDSLYRIKLKGYTLDLLRKNPEAYFPEIAGEGVPTVRNPKLLEEDYWTKRDIRRQIKRDPQWMLAVSSQMAMDGVSLQQAIGTETEHVMQGLPSLRNKNVSAAEYRETLILQTEQQIRNYKEWFDAVKTDAEKRGITIDEAVRNHATYTVDQRILEGKIILPETDTIQQHNP